MPRHSQSGDALRYVCTFGTQAHATLRHYLHRRHLSCPIPRAKQPRRRFGRLHPHSVHLFFKLNVAFQCLAHPHSAPFPRSFRDRYPPPNRPALKHAPFHCPALSPFFISSPLPTPSLPPLQMGTAQRDLPQPQPSQPPSPTPVSHPSQTLPLSPTPPPNLFEQPQNPVLDNKPIRKRRGRPRSPVFAYYRRLVDEHGNFLGNQCTFCPFVSRDRSENPTYLTRHIIRSCAAPDHIKSALAARFTHSNVPYAISSTVTNAHVISTTSTVAVPPAAHAYPIANCSPQSAHPAHHAPLQPPASQPNASSRQPDLHRPPLHAPPTSQSTAPVPSHSNAQSSPLQTAYSAALQPASAAAATVPPLPDTLPQSTPVHPSHQPQHHQPTTKLTHLASPTHQSFVRPIGITKSRRGRPRSPALLYFRRLVDEKGSFMQNQCMYCPFISRDRSENSTLLLRHLLSPSCHAPEHVCQQLRMHRGAAKVMRKNNQPNTMMANGMPPSDAHAYRQNLVLCALRFMLANDLPLDSAGSPLFRDLMLCGRWAADKQQHPLNFSAPDGEHAALQLSKAELDTYLTDHSIEHLMGPFSDDPPVARVGAQLLIYFTDLSHEATTSSKMQHTNKSDIRVTEESAAYIASVFRFVSGSHLSYLFSKNCHVNFSCSLADIVAEAQQCSTIKCDQIIISRPLIDVHKPRQIPRDDDAHVWMPDMVREVDILCQELLAQVPLLIRVRRRNTVLATYFQEEFSKAVGQELFGRNSDEKEQFERYQNFLARRPHSIQSFHVVETAMHTYDLLCQAQSSHEDSQRFLDTRTFMSNLTEDNCGNAPLSREVIRLLLSVPCCSDLKAFLSVMKPLTSLISLYTSKYDTPMRFSGAVYDMADLFRCPLTLRVRSLSHVLPDCVQTLREVHAGKFREQDSELQQIRQHVLCRLLGKGVDGCPPIADGISYFAAFLNPSRDLLHTKGLMVEEAWKKATMFVEKHYSGSGGMSASVILQQLHEFHDRKGRFSHQDLFRNLPNDCDPIEWWQIHGNVAPELRCVALRILCVPTTAFPAVRHITNLNACTEDLQTGGRDSLMEKRRFLTWNLRLCVNRLKEETKLEEDTQRFPPTKEENPML